MQVPSFEYRNCSISQMLRELMAKFPNKSIKELKRIVLPTKRMKFSKYETSFCSGTQEVARRKSQIERGFIRASA